MGCGEHAALVHFDSDRVAFAALVLTANVYLSLYQRLRVDIRKERAVAERTEKKASPRAS